MNTLIDRYTQNKLFIDDSYHSWIEERKTKHENLTIKFLLTLKNKINYFHFFMSNLIWVAIQLSCLTSRRHNVPTHSIGMSL